MAGEYRADELERENEALRARLSRLSEASLRINESLELDTVLQGALDAARSLAGARYGVITLLDEAGEVQKFLSSGMTKEEARRIRDTPDGMRIFEYLDSLSAPLRIPDLLGRLESLGLPGFSPPTSVGGVLSFLAAPLSHRGERLGHIFVADRQQSSEFTLLDEETLVMFASQATLVIANARHYREERRARTDLETLLDTSPVGVVVFDAHTGEPVSVNREVGRLLNGLRQPGQATGHPPEGLTVRRADGSEISITSFPVADSFRVREAIRAEEVTLSVPDGRSVSLLVNATPVLADDGSVTSFMVTLQDLTPLDDLERLRADFLAMVSHELRMPLTSIKGSAATALSGAATMERTEIVEYLRIMDRQADRMHDLIGGLLDVARIETGTLPVNPKPTSVGGLTEEAKQAFVSGGGRRSVEVELPDDPLWVMADRDRIVQALGNLLSNAARRSPEASSIRVTASREEGHVAVSVSDEGGGAPAEFLPRLFGKFSPSDSGDGVSGFGPGLDLAICKGIVEAHGGRIHAESDGPGLGARFTFTLPAVEVGEPVEPIQSDLQASPSPRERTPILAVDGDPQSLRYIREVLSGAGYLPIVTGDPADVPRLMEEHRPRLALLDLLQNSDGIKLMSSVMETADMPVIFLSFYGEESLIARALDMGAADYVVKPFSTTELTARIRAALRGRSVSGWATPTPPYCAGDLRIDYAERRVTVDGRPVQLTATEYETLHRLSTASGRVLTHDQLLEWIWSPERKGEPWLVRNVIKRLRSKLGDDANDPTYIFTEPRVGYRMARNDQSD